MTPRRARLAVDLFTGLVIASVAFAGAALTWRLAGFERTGPLAAPVISGRGQAIDVTGLIALAPFGKAVVTGAAGDGGALRLRAIFLASPVEASVALIAGVDGKVASYAIGQAVGDGVIEAIEAEQVVLRTAGGQRVLGFNPQVPTAAPPAVAAAANAGAAPAPAAPGSPAPPTGAAAVRAQVPRSAQGLPQAPPPAAAPAPATPAGSGPVSQPGPAQAGYRIGDSPNAALASAGIRPGDVVLTVNGAAIGPGTNERALMAQAVAAGTARLEIMRNGRRVSLNVPVR